MCGFCVANPLGGTTCDSGNALSEGCAGNVGVDDDCDGTVDEETPDPTCDGLDDDCDGTADEDWDAFRELTPAAVFVPGCGDVPPHLECQGAAGIARIATPGLDYCDGPGAFPSPTGSGFLWCGGDVGDPCGALPCRAGLACVGGLCAGTVPPGCFLLCDPANTTICSGCERRGFGTECVWPGTPP